jgi:hypothetical protein
VVLGPVLGRVRIDEHPAHRVLHPVLALRRRRLLIVVVITMMTVMVAMALLGCAPAA